MNSDKNSIRTLFPTRQSANLDAISSAVVDSTPPPQLFTMEELDEAYRWICNLRKEYSAHSDIWALRRNWNEIKHSLLGQLNEGSYQFSILDRYEIDGAFVSLWASSDMIALKLIAKALQNQMAGHISKSCYHVKGHGGLKKAVKETHQALPEYTYVFRSDVKGYYESIDLNILFSIIETYVDHPILLKLIVKACYRTETTGGIFYDFFEKGIPMGSPLSPLLGAIALIPLDQAMEGIKGVFYCRFMDDWIVLTKSKTALRKVIKLTHKIIKSLKFRLHPTKTYIGKIIHGFNFLAYYLDDQKILPSQETIRRFFERASALYEPSPTRKLKKYKRHQRDVSEYQVNEPEPTEASFKATMKTLTRKACNNSDLLEKLRKYLRKWACWLKCGSAT